MKRLNYTSSGTVNMGSMGAIQTKPIYMTSEILINSDGRILHADKAFCDIFSCKNPDATRNSIVLDFFAEDFKHIVVNAFIDTFYGRQEGKRYEVKMLDVSGTPLEVTINFLPVKAAQGEKATLLIRRRVA
ncbi:MAG: PAS domain-containing protein [Cyclobacteriaceae bacterium]|nr:PAS domain-containing protein [Cyclobacteriaceae bacterium]